MLPPHGTWVMEAREIVTLKVFCKLLRTPDCALYMETWCRRK